MHNYIYSVEGRFWEIQRFVGRISGEIRCVILSLCGGATGVTGTKILTPLELEEISTSYKTPSVLVHQYNKKHNTAQTIQYEK